MVLFKGHESGVSCSKCCWIFLLLFGFLFGGVGFFGFVLLFGFFCQGFCEALTGLSGSLLRQLCVGK